MFEARKAEKTASVTRMDIVETAIEAGTFTTLVSAVKAAGLTETLKGTGPFTMFAPSDDAFKKLPGGEVEGLLKPENKAKLVSILKYHVVPGKVSSQEVSGKTLKRKSIEGSEISIDATKGVKVNGATVVTPDIQATNGVIHIIDSVIMPPAR